MKIGSHASWSKPAGLSHSANIQYSHIAYAALMAGKVHQVYDSAGFGACLQQHPGAAAVGSPAMRETICLREPRMCRALDTASAMAASASFLFLAGAAAAALAAASGPGSTIWHTAAEEEESHSLWQVRLIMHVKHYRLTSATSKTFKSCGAVSTCSMLLWPLPQHHCCRATMTILDHMTWLSCVYVQLQRSDTEHLSMLDFPVQVYQLLDKQDTFCKQYALQLEYQYSQEPG